MTYFVNVTSQGQISIPVGLRRKYGFDKTRRALVVERGQGIEILPVGDIFELEGAFKTDKKIPFIETRRQFEEALARGEV